MIKFKYFKDNHKWKTGYTPLETCGLSSNQNQPVTEKFHPETPHDEVNAIPPIFQIKKSSWPTYDKNETHGYPHITNQNHKNAIEEYTGDSFNLNTELYKHHKQQDLFNPPSASFIKQVKHLDEVLGAHAATKDMHVYTGIKQSPLRKSRNHGGGVSDQEDMNTHIKGVLPSYTSASMHPDVARRFSTADELDKYGHMLKIHIPEGSKHGMYIGHHSVNPHEQEFLIKRGAKIHIHPEPEVHDLTDDDRISGFTKPIKIWHAKIVE